MATKIETALKPLIANLKRLDFNWYLVGSEFEIIMLENNFDEIWSTAVRTQSTAGYVKKSISYEEAFIETCNLFWKKHKDFFFEFITVSIAGFIALKKNKNADIVFKPLEDLGINQDDLNKLKKLHEDNKRLPAAYPTDKAYLKKKDLVFIGHGRSPLWREVDSFLREENIPFEVFESHSRTGEHVIDVLKEFLSKATFAVIVVTAEDQTEEGKMRARQNVIHEIGLFQGKLGFENVAILKQSDVEGFSNNDGLQHISFSGNDIKHTFYELGRTLKKAGFKK